MYLHGGDEMKSLFTKEQIDELRLNPYTYHVSNTTIKFTEEFKDAFWRLYLQDMPLRDIVRTLGYDYDVLGEKRVGGQPQKEPPDTGAKGRLLISAANYTSACQY